MASMAPDVAFPRSLGIEGNEVPDDECRWACMISHHQEPAKFMARTLQELLERQLVAEGQPLTKVWLGRMQAANREGMYEGVRRSRCLVALLTKDYFTVDGCIQEIRWALHHRKNIVLVYVTDPRHGGVAGSFSEYYRPQLKLAFPDESDFDHIMRNAYIQFTPDGGQGMLMLRNPQTQRGVLDQMRLPARTAQVPPPLPPLCILAARASSLPIHGEWATSEWATSRIAARTVCGAKRCSMQPGPIAVARLAVYGVRCLALRYRRIPHSTLYCTLQPWSSARPSRTCTVPVAH
jgi:hypothetical protein